jgi:hypothetical protein
VNERGSTFPHLPPSFIEALSVAGRAGDTPMVTG